MTPTELRRALGMTQERFAREVGCSVHTVRKWDQGITTPTTLAYVVRLAQLERGLAKQGKET